MSQTFKAFEHERWQQSVEQYDASFGGLTRQTMVPLLNALEVGQDSTFLDVACGPGYLSALAKERHAVVLGLDFAPAMVELARKRYPSLHFDVGDAEQLPVSDSSFDAVALNFVLVHLAEPEQALHEAYRVLRPKGRVGFTVWADPQSAPGFGLVLEAIQQHGDINVPLPQAPSFFHYSQSAKCHASLERAGFAPNVVSTLPLVWELSSPQEVFDAFYRGTARTGGLLRRQTPEALNRIRDAVMRSALQFQHGDKVVIPMPALMAVGFKG